MSTALSLRTAEKIREMILSGQYPMGEKIPNEQELIKKFCVSRSTVREAVKILAAQNILEIRRGIGTYVTKTPGATDDPLGLDFLNREERISATSEFRIYIEPHIAGFAAERATPQDASELVSLAHESKTVLEKLYRTQSETLNDKAGELDILFHKAVYKCCHNPIIDCLSAYGEQFLIESYMMDGYRKRHRKYSYPDTHLKIANAIQQKDREMAVLLMKRHVASSDEFFRYAVNSHHSMDDEHIDI